MRTIIIEVPTERLITTSAGRQVLIPTTERIAWNEEADYHCIACGVAPVYVRPGDGDYYVGPEYLCAACNASWTMQDGGTDEQQATLLRAQLEAT